jgi:predicted nuclease with TOPRIM domain
MVFATARLLLTQSFVLSMAARMKIASVLATKKGGDSPADKLAEVFASKENTICGGLEIRDELTKGNSVGGMRTTNWEKVLKIADEYLKGVLSEIPKLTTQVKELEEELAKSEADQAFKDATKDDLIPLVTRSISQPSTFIDKATALKSKCGFAISDVNKEIRAANRATKKEARKQGNDNPVLLPSLDKECWQHTVAQFTTELQELLSGTKVRATSNSVLAACCEIVECQPGIDIPYSYCDELCTRMAGNPALNEVEYLGGSVSELRKQLEEASAKLKDTVHEQKECEAAQIALLEFQSQLTEMNNEIDRTFDVQKKANAALQMAEEELEDLLDEADDLEAKKEEAQSKLEEDELAANGLASDLQKLKQAEPGIREEMEDAINQFEGGVKLVNEATTALNSFNKLKVLVASTVSKMWLYFSDAVLTPLNNLGLEKGMPVEEYFEKEYESNDEYGQLLGDLEGLTKHCDASAKPAFTAIKEAELKQTLLDMCAYTPAEESAKEFATTVLTIGDKMLEHLKTAQAWHDTPKERPDLIEKGEPAGLRMIETAFAPSAYFSSYLERWKADSGDFLKLLASLNTLLAQLKEQRESFEKIKDRLIGKLEDHIKKKKATFTKLAQAVAKKDKSAQELEQAKEEEQATSDLVDKQEASVANLRKIFEEAWAAYKAAEALFEATQKKGTNLE